MGNDGHEDPDHANNHTDINGVLDSFSHGSQHFLVLEKQQFYRKCPPIIAFVVVCQRLRPDATWHSDTKGGVT